MKKVDREKYWTMYKVIYHGSKSRVICLKVVRETEYALICIKNEVIVSVPKRACRSALFACEETANNALKDYLSNTLIKKKTNLLALQVEIEQIEDLLNS